MIYRNPNGPDRRIRELERLVAQGDPEAADRLGQLLWQAGRSSYQTEVALAVIRRGQVGRTPLEWHPTWEFPGALIWRSRWGWQAIATPWHGGDLGFVVQVENRPGRVMGSSRLVPLAQTGNVAEDALEYRRLIKPLLEDLAGPEEVRWLSDAGWDFNPDPRLRDLERAAAAGDPEAALQLVHARHRAGLLHPAALFLLARIGEEPERAAATEIFDRTFMRPLLWPFKDKHGEYEWPFGTEYEALENTQILGSMFYQLLYEDIGAEVADGYTIPIERLIFRRRTINQIGILAEDYLLNVARVRRSQALQSAFDLFESNLSRAARALPESAEAYQRKASYLNVALGFMILILDQSWAFAEEEELPDRWFSECRGEQESLGWYEEDDQEFEEAVEHCLAEIAQDRVNWTNWPPEEVRVLHQQGEWIAQSAMPLRLQLRDAFNWIVPRLVAWLRAQEA